MRFENLALPATADFHVHLRDDEMMELVVPSIRQGGCDTVLVMPNLQPPVDSVGSAISYYERLMKLAPDVKFLMTLYLTENITPNVIADAAQSGCIAGVKVYPQGVTTNSESGVQDYEHYYPVFAAMQEHDMVLNLHGEVPCTPAKAYTNDETTDAVTILNAEAKFLPTLLKLHRAFPRLRIVLEHCSTSAAIEAVRSCGPTVAGTITAHHLWLTTDDVCGDAFNFCKPLAKRPEDRIALLKAAVSGNEKFFFGSDSAPHPVKAKTRGKAAAAGCFTQGWTTALVLAALDEAINLGWIPEQISTALLEGFLSGYGRKFYKLSPSSGPGIMMENHGHLIPEIIRNKPGSVEVVPFRSGEVALTVRWLE